MAVHKRLQAQPNIQAELAIRYWLDKGNFQRFTLIKLAHCNSYKEAWALEHRLIQLWQPRLNFPFISRFLARKALGFQPNMATRRSTQFRFGRRLWAKLRRRLFGTRVPTTIMIDRTQAWEHIFDLSSATRASFEAAKILRSSRVTDAEVHALLKLTHALEQPAKGRVLGIFRSICEFRNMSWPASARSLCVPFLAQEDFAAQLQQWLRTTILNFKDILILFHLPSHKVRKGAHHLVCNQLFNFRQWGKKA